MSKQPLHTVALYFINFMHADELDEYLYGDNFAALGLYVKRVDGGRSEGREGGGEGSVVVVVVGERRNLAMEKLCTGKVPGKSKGPKTGHKVG